MIKWIIAAEVSFWFFIIAGLFVRYILKKEKLSLVLFLLTPLIDLALVILTTMDLKNGATAGAVHGISAIYIGVSIAYGKSMIAWADEKFQVWFFKKPSLKKSLSGMEKGIYEVKMWGKHVLAYFIGSAMFWFIITIAGTGGTDALVNIWRIWTVVLLVDGTISVSYILFPKKALTK